MSAAPFSKSPGARQPAKSTVAAGELSADERLASTVDGSAAVPKAMVGTVGSLGVEAVVTSVTPESGAKNLAVPKEQTVLPEASEGMVGPAILPPSP